jgi:hypothetical protein
MPDFCIFIGYLENLMVLLPYIQIFICVALDFFSMILYNYIVAILISWLCSSFAEQTTAAGGR